MINTIIYNYTTQLERQVILTFLTNLYTPLISQGLANITDNQIENKIYYRYIEK